MNRKIFIDIYDRLEGLVSKLPGSLQEPILRELRPVKQYFLLQRPPRLALFAPDAPLWGHAVNSLLNQEVFTERSATNTDTTDWFAARVEGRGFLQLAAVKDVSGQSFVSVADAALAIVAANSPEIDQQAAQLTELLASTLPPDARDTPLPAVIGVVVARGEESGENAQAILHAALRGNAIIAPRVAATIVVRVPENFTAPNPAVFEESHAAFSRAITRELPMESRLDAARLFDVADDQEEIARTLIKSISAVSGVIGAQPIPFADFPILTTLQIAMICGIIYISGEEPTIPLAGRFLTATGVNFGAALVLREGARGLSKLLPGWGQAIGGGVAAAGTYAIGKAATAHFIRGAGMDEAKGLFRELQGRVFRRK